MWIAVIRAVLTLLPWLVKMYEEGRLRKQTQEELIWAIGQRWNERVELARTARQGDLESEETDRYNRRNTGADS